MGASPGRPIRLRPAIPKKVWYTSTCEWEHWLLGNIPQLEAAQQHRLQHSHTPAACTAMVKPPSSNGCLCTKGALLQAAAPHLILWPIGDAAALLILRQGKAGRGGAYGRLS